MLNLDALPGKMAIVGGGYIALEFAGIYNNFGTEVHVLWRQARPGPSRLATSRADAFTKPWQCTCGRQAVVLPLSACAHNAGLLRAHRMRGRDSSGARFP